MDDGDEVQVFFSINLCRSDDDSDGYYWFQDCDDNDSDRSPLSEWLNESMTIVMKRSMGFPSDGLLTRDGLIDVDEFNIYMTEWQDADTDDDGMHDGYELYIGTNPLFADLDNDGDGARWFQDCDDNNSDISPYAVELRNGIDDNCNDEIDESACTRTEIDGCLRIK